MKRLVLAGLLLAFLGLPASTAVAAETNAVGEQRLKQDGVCTRCHDESETKPILAIYQTPHGVISDERTPSCQSCHGQSAAHLAGDVAGKGLRPPPDVIFGSAQSPAGYSPTDAQSQTEVCLTCHKASLRMHWPGSQHQANDVVCANCHTVHNATDPMLVKVLQPSVCFKCHQEQRAQTKQISTHPIDVGKMACSDCHNPHGSAGPHLLVKNTVTETCTMCHAEKRGPFLWEHQPVNEDCTNCHTPHGSNITPLLKSRPPFLCDECHDGPHNSQAPYGTAVGGLQAGGALAGGSPNSNAVGRSCMNCHVMIHGSNSPAGAFLHR
ncbi:MAG: DmsE family decaheme c-type cytochrome [Rhodanobacteraceae bacterium]